MTLKVKGFTVTLKQDFREDDVEVIKSAIEMIKGVAHVEPSLITSDDHIQRSRIKIELTTKILKAINED